MAADTITIPRDELFEATAWLLAVEELLEAIEELTPSTLLDGSGLRDLEFGVLTTGLMQRLAEVDFAGLDDEEMDREPSLVVLYASARERAAWMVRNHERAVGEEGMFAFKGDRLTAKGLRLLADKLAADALLTRELGRVQPPRTVHLAS